MSRLMPARSLDESGRCCGRKPLVYKRPTPHFFCTKCDAEFDPSGRQRANWAWTPVKESFFATYASNEFSRKYFEPLPPPPSEAGR